MLFQAFGDVVRVKDGVFGGLGQARPAHCGDIGPGNREDARAAPRRGRDCADRILAAQIYHGMAGQEVHQMFGYGNWSHARPAAAVRDAEGLVQIQMAHVGPDVGRPAETNLRVEVRAVHIDLPAVGVNDFADFFDRFFEHAVRRGIGDHERCEIVLLRLGFGAEVLQRSDPP